MSRLRAVFVWPSALVRTITPPPSGTGRDSAIAFSLRRTSSVSTLRETPQVLSNGLSTR